MRPAGVTAGRWVGRAAAGVRARALARPGSVPPTHRTIEPWARARPGDDGVARPARTRLEAAQDRPRTASGRGAHSTGSGKRTPTRVWLPLGHGSWEAYCDAQFGTSRAWADRLLDIAPAVAAVPDRGMPQLALVVVSGRTDAVTELITRRLHALSHRRSPQTFDAGVAAHHAVREMSACPHRSGSAVHRSIERGMLHEQPGDRSAATTACPRPQATSCAADTSVRPPKRRPGRGGPGRDAEGIAWPSRRQPR